MLSVVEKYIGPIRDMQSEADVRAVLADIAREHGFRYAFLIEYEPDFSAARHIVDTYPERAAAWPELFRTKGFAPGVQGIRWMLDRDMVIRLTGDRFGDAHPYLEFARKYDLSDAVAVPISQGESIAGLVSYAGTPELDRTEMTVLQLLSYSLFSQLRLIDREIKTPEPSLPPLTPREKEVMRLSAIGMTSTEIAAKLGMSPRTVNQHVDNVADKLGTRNRTHTIAELVRNDMLN